MYHYGLTIRAYREKAKMTQAQLADRWPKSELQAYNLTVAVHPMTGELKSMRSRGDDSAIAPELLYLQTSPERTRCTTARTIFKEVA